MNKILEKIKYGTSEIISIKELEKKLALNKKLK
jgi:hypothetical protein